MTPFPFGFQPDGGAAYDLSGAELASHTGAVPMRNAAFEYIARDGGDIEGLGAGIEPYTFTCFYTGENYGTRLQALRFAIQTQPRGLLTHPELGKIRAYCLGIDDYAVNYVTERETVNFRISFKQDGTDTTKLGDIAPTVSTLAARYGRTIDKVNTSITDILTLVSPAVGTAGSVATAIALFPTTVNVLAQSVISTTAALINFATIFANSAVQIATLGQVDLTLDAQRDRVFIACQETLTALRNTGLSDAALYPALAQVRGLYAQTLDLDTLTRTQSPEVNTVVIQGRQPLVVFAAQQYGGQAAIGKVDELRVNNKIGSFGLNPGQSMRVIGATVDPNITA